MILLIRRHKKSSHYDLGSNIDPIPTVVVMDKEETNHECVFPNPTYQDIQRPAVTTEAENNPETELSVILEN